MTKRTARNWWRIMAAHLPWRVSRGMTEALDSKKKVRCRVDINYAATWFRELADALEKPDAK